MPASQPVLPHLARHWWTVGIPGRITPPANYAPVELAALPPAPAGLDGELAWLRALPDTGGSLAGAPGSARRDATTANLDALVAGLDLALPQSFTTFVGDETLHDKLRSATSCYLELGDHVVPARDGGRLVHVVSDQQWVFHWLLYLGPDGGEAVVVTPIPLGFLSDSGTVPEGTLDLEASGLPVVVCAESFVEFLWRWRIENEIWMASNGLRAAAPALTAEEQAYVDAYPTTEAVWP